jgi:hypothetical protein
MTRSLERNEKTPINAGLDASPDSAFAEAETAFDGREEAFWDNL